MFTSRHQPDEKPPEQEKNLRNGELAQYLLDVYESLKNLRNGEMAQFS